MFIYWLLGGCVKIYHNEGLACLLNYTTINSALYIESGLVGSFKFGTVQFP